ncbi:MAG: hypothetical protein GXY64_03295 [Bacteroidales bacterium]|nr:hypothetical protein [Bacteroidales bacterium]
MIAPQINYSEREERLAFILERYQCKYPSCGGCGFCHLPGGKPAIEVFADYIDGKVEYATIASRVYAVSK